MADPLSTIASTLAVADATKSVISACHKYIKHAKNAPKELRLLVEDLEDLNVTIKKLDEIAKSQWSLHATPIDPTLNEWRVPLIRLVDYASRVKGVLDKQDLKLGVFHEIPFRALWPKAWKEIQILLANIEKEKNKLHLATAIEGVGLVRQVYMLVDESFTSRHNHHFEQAPMPWKPLRIKETLPFFFDVLGPYLGWKDAKYDYPGLDDPHNRYIEACAEHSCDLFLGSPVYLGWKNRKTLGPSLLQVAGTVGSGKSILCAQIVRDLQASNGKDIGIAYFHNDTSSTDLVSILQYLIMQLAFQAQSLPMHLDKTAIGKSSLKSMSPTIAQDTERKLLTTLLISILPNFRRTYFVLDEFHADCRKYLDTPSTLTQLLEQDLGNVSIAVATTPYPHTPKNSALDFPDVSIRLLQVEYRADDITNYVDSRFYFIENDFMVYIALFKIMKEAIVIASDNLYLAADMFIDSAVQFMRTQPTHRELEAHIREIRESSEVMMQRDPEIMKQKQIIANVSHGREDDADDFESSDHMRKKARVSGKKSGHGVGVNQDAGEGSSRTQ